jgi:hypothetical protein
MMEMLSIITNRGLAKLWTVVKDTHFFINVELGQHLPAIPLVSFLEQTYVSSE